MCVITQIYLKIEKMKSENLSVLLLLLERSSTGGGPVLILFGSKTGMLE